MCCNPCLVVQGLTASEYGISGPWRVIMSQWLGLLESLTVTPMWSLVSIVGGFAVVVGSSAALPGLVARD